MSPTLDEGASVSDPRYTEHVKRSAFLLAVHQAIEIDGMPAPMHTQFTRAASDLATLRVDDDAVADVDDWAARLGLTAGYQFGDEILRTASRSFRTYRAEGVWNGFRINIWTAEYVTEPDQCPQGHPTCETGDDGSCHDACEPTPEQVAA